MSDGATSATPSLSLSSSSNTLTLQAGQTVQATLTSTAGAAFKSAVTLGVAGAPPGVTTTLGSANIASPGSGSVALTVAASTTARPGTYALTVTAQGGGETAKVTISVVIPQPTFTLSVSAVSANIGVGGTVQVSIAATAKNGFNSSIALSLSSLPAGVLSRPSL